MKPLSLTLCCGLLCLASGAQAQNAQSGAAEQLNTKSYRYGFVQLQGGMETTFTDVNALDIITPTFSVAGGYMFTPAVGVRLHLNGFKSTGGFDINRKVSKYEYSYINTNADLMLNVLGVFRKTQDNPFKLYLIGGVGLNYAWDNNEFATITTQNKVYSDITNAWGEGVGSRKDLLSHNVRVGVLADYNINKHWGVGLEVDMNSLNDRFNSKFTNSDDWMLTAQLSVSYKFAHKPLHRAVKTLSDIQAGPQQLSDILAARLGEWSKQMPGESLEDYQLRVNDKTRAQQMRRIGQELATEKGLAEIGLPKMNLRGYNPATNMLSVGLGNGLPDIYLNVSEQALGKMNAGDLELRNVKYGLGANDQLELVYADVYDRATGQTYTYNNLDGQLADLGTDTTGYTPLAAIQQSIQEKERLTQLKEEITKAAKEESLISDHTNIKVKTNVVPGTDANGNPIQNYEVGVTYTVDKEFSMRDDFGPGKYKLTDSNAGAATMKIMKQALEGDFAKYVVAGKRLKVKISGSADAMPIRRTIAYDGCYGDFVKQPITKEGKPSKITVTQEGGITDNYQLAFLRAVGVKEYMQKQIPALNKMKTDYDYDISVSDQKGSEYRKVSIVLTFEDAF